MNSVDAKNVLVIYHREDNDGVCSAAIVSQFLKTFDNPDVNVQFFGSNYAGLSEIWKEHVDALLAHDEEALAKTTITKWVSNFDQIYMVDISFSEVDAMECIYKSKPNGDFIWCDHHRPIIEFSLANMDRYGFGNTPGIRRTDQSAILNTWEYMNNALGTTIRPSRTLVMLSDYDSWAWAHKVEYDTNENKDLLFALNTGFTHRSDLRIRWFEDYILNVIQDNTLSMRITEEDCIRHGSIVLEYDRRRNMRAINTHGDTSWTIGGEKACAIFTTDHFNSQSFTSAFEGTDTKHGLVFKRQTDGRWVLSAYNVYNDSDFDCGAYLRANYCGGGHKGAAGCTLSQDQFIEMLKTHQV